MQGWEETTVAGIAKKILTLPGKAGRHVVITQGADATIVATSEVRRCVPSPSTPALRCLRSEQAPPLRDAQRAFHATAAAAAASVRVWL